MSFYRAIKMSSTFSEVVNIFVINRAAVWSQNMSKGLKLILLRRISSLFAFSNSVHLMENVLIRGSSVHKDLKSTNNFYRRKIQWVLLLFSCFLVFMFSLLFITPHVYIFHLRWEKHHHLLFSLLVMNLKSRNEWEH